MKSVILMFVLSSAILLTMMCTNLDDLQYTILFQLGYVLTNIVLSFTLINRFRINQINKKQYYRNLSRLGLNYEEIRYTTKKEKTLMYEMIAVLSLVYLSNLNIAFVYRDKMGVLSALFLILELIIPLFISYRVAVYQEIIKTANLKKVYGLDTPYPKTALNGVSISVNKGTFACIMGTSGSGKTTLINILSTIDEATSGKLLIFDQNIVGLSDKEKANIRKRYMGFIFQDYNLIDSLKVIDNILFSLKLNKKNIINEAEIKQIISSLGIEELLDKYPFECSGGQQQRIAIARALVCKPKILFADEPTGNVDSIRAKQLMEYFTEINRKYGITIVMVTHDCLVASYASEMYYVEDGKIINHIFKGNDSFEKFYNRIARISMQIKL